MKKNAIFGLLVIILAFCFIGCGSDDDEKDGVGGILTINNISLYDNRYAHFYTYDKVSNDSSLLGVENISMSGYTMVQIKNGSVSLPMWTIASSGQWSRYSGNDTISDGVLAIFISSSFDWDDAIEINLQPFTFLNGNATISIE